MVLNDYDVVSSMVLTFIGVFGIIFVSLDKEIHVQEQNDLPTEGKKSELRTFATVLAALFVALFGALTVWCVGMMLPSQAKKEREAHRKQCSELTTKLHAAVKAASFLD